MDQSVAQKLLKNLIVRYKEVYWMSRIIPTYLSLPACPRGLRGGVRG